MSTSSSDLKKFLDAKKTETRLIGPIERHLLARPEQERSYLHIHPSDMVKSDWCHREACHLLLGRPKRRERPNLRLQSIFDEGHTIHAKWQNWIAEMGSLYGRWEASDGTNLGMLRSNVAPNGAVYKEVPLRNEALMIKGHSDGWVKGIGDDFLIEIKSIGSGTIRMESPDLLYQADGDLSKAFRSIRRPFRTHALQGRVYLELIERQAKDEGWTDYPKEIVFIYELKMDQDYKEFVTKADYESVAHLFDAADDIVRAVKAGEVLPCNINRKSGFCKACAPYEEVAA